MKGILVVDQEVEVGKNRSGSVLAVLGKEQGQKDNCILEEEVVVVQYLVLISMVL